MPPARFVCNYRGVNSEGFLELGGPLFHDRREAGAKLARALEDELAAAVGPVIVGLARGGVEVAVEVALAHRIPLDALAVRKVGHPGQPEYALGAVAPGGEVFVRDPGGIPEEALAAAIAAAQRDADELDRRLHVVHPPLDLAGATCVLCDDGLATGATMIAAIRWARAHGAARVLAAVPVAAAETAAVVRREADGLVCLYELRDFWAVGVWYRSFNQVSDVDVVRLLDEAARPQGAPA